MRRRHWTISFLGPRRRARVVVLCIIGVVILIIIFGGLRFSKHPTRSEEIRANELRLSRYLSLVTPRTRAKSTSMQVVATARPTESEPSPIDEIAGLRPTPQEIKVADVDEDENIDPAEEALMSSKHTYDKNGLLIVDPDGSHPAYELIRSAETHWQAKVRRASKTLEHAVKEYKRRYNRLPPKGFDHWWNYIQKYDVQLPDEYDQIYHDLEPYWGIDPRLLQSLQTEREGIPDSFTIGKNADEDIVTLLNMTISDAKKDKMEIYLSWNAKPQMELLGEVYQYIPPFRATFNTHDSPSQLADWTWRGAAVEAAGKGTYLKPEDLPSQGDAGWSSACPPESPLYLDQYQNDGSTGQKPKTFIYDHKTSMSPCYHPQHILSHGTFLAYDTSPEPEQFTSPLLSACATALHVDIHTTSMAQSSAFVYEDSHWEDKEDDRLYWRGSPSEVWNRPGAKWRSNQRVRVVNLTGLHGTSQDVDLNVDADSEFEAETASVSFLSPAGGVDEPVGEPVLRSRRRTNSALMDVNFSGPISDCAPGVICDAAMRSELSWDEFYSSDNAEEEARAGRYKYVLDIDGDGDVGGDDGECSSSSFRRLMSSHALVFKSTLFPEWWTDRAQAWVHYVPVQIDYSDLYDSLVFFGGDLSGEGAHEEMAKKIASAGREWVERFWRKEDVTAYMFRLWLEYARVMSLDRDAMSFHSPQDD